MRSVRTIGSVVAALFAAAVLAAPPALAAPDNHPSDNTGWLIALGVIVALVALALFLWLGRVIARGGRSDHFRH